MTKLIINLSLLALLFTSCSIKNDDSSTDKFIKHTVNSPIYVIAVVGFLGTEASEKIAIAIIYPPYATYKYLTKDNNVTADTE